MCDKWGGKEGRVACASPSEESSTTGERRAAAAAGEDGPSADGIDPTAPISSGAGAAGGARGALGMVAAPPPLLPQCAAARLPEKAATAATPAGA